MNIKFKADENIKSLSDVSPGSVVRKNNDFYLLTNAGTDNDMERRVVDVRTGEIVIMHRNTKVILIRDATLML